MTANMDRRPDVGAAATALAFREQPGERTIIRRALIELQMIVRRKAAPERRRCNYGAAARVVSVESAPVMGYNKRSLWMQEEHGGWI